MCYQKGIGVILCEGRERGVCSGRMGLGGLLPNWSGCGFRPPAVLDGLSTGPEREGVPVGQVGVVFRIS
jgi:hypothetical protein